MDIKIELIICAKIFASALMGALLGYDREKHGSNAGIRTYAAVCCGAALFTAIASHLMNDTSAPSRIIANIITGIGFIGAGIIFKNNNDNKSRGLTTAATLWAASGIGVAMALDMFIIAAASTFIIYSLLAIHHLQWYVNWKKNINKKIDADFEEDNT